MRISITVIIVPSLSDDKGEVAHLHAVVRIIPTGAVIPARREGIWFEKMYSGVRPGF